MVNHPENEGKKIKSVLKQKERKTYIKPRLSTFGHIEKLTQGGGSGRLDGASTRFR